MKVGCRDSRTREAILWRLRNNEIFREHTWDETCLKEASYALRIVNDGLLVDGKFYDPGNHYTQDYISIEPGKIVILSTEERLNMPADLVGKIGIRLEYALRGLTGLMGIQVDPLYGHDKDSERLFIRVANFGNETIRLCPGDKVFTFELHKVAGYVPRIPKGDSWQRIKDVLRHQQDSSWSYVTRVEHDLSAQTNNIRENLQPVVIFGVFLVAVTILGVVISMGPAYARSDGSQRLRMVVTMGANALSHCIGYRSFGHCMGWIHRGSTILASVSSGQRDGAQVAITESSGNLPGSARLRQLPF